ncbi:MAG: histidine ammonia-lyase [Bacteroidetes bacterium HGW-Bacteroidetes-21]|nr:MAG: histidine ammonia-lyase [Bacteroidetes bacterium HGW-Bacteroidetes-21]
MNKYIIDSNFLDYKSISVLLKNPEIKISLSAEAIQRIEKCRNYLDQKIAQASVPIYGVNTGFGSLCDTSISESDLEQLQYNLVVSHACGMGDEVKPEIVKLMLLLKVQALSRGYSGVAIETVQRLVDFYNNDIIPVVYQLGSLGASGDLSPLAHLSLPLLGLGEVYFKGERMPSAEVLTHFNWKPLRLKSKEGLALLNGTQFMGAYSVQICLRTFSLSKWADVISAISLDAFDGLISPFHPLIQEVRPHKGQRNTAQRVRELLTDSEITKQSKKHVQDPYSFRCIPQVHGASKDTIDYVSDVIAREINSVTDNPTVFPDEDLIISAGNFHGQPIAISIDSLCIALAELGNISERRTYQLISGKRNLPHFLVVNPGLNSGFMIPQYTAASIVNQNKILCTPASVDSIESSQGQEDHVSMGANAVTKAWRVVENVERILAIELFNAVQALEFRRPLKSGSAIEKMVEEYRKIVPFIENDCIMHDQMKSSLRFIRDYPIHNDISGAF